MKTEELDNAFNRKLEEIYRQSCFCLRIFTEISNSLLKTRAKVQNKMRKKENDKRKIFKLFWRLGFSIGIRNSFKKDFSEAKMYFRLETGIRIIKYIF